MKQNNVGIGLLWAIAIVLVVGLGISIYKRDREKVSSETKKIDTIVKLDTSKTVKVVLDSSVFIYVINKVDSLNDSILLYKKQVDSLQKVIRYSDYRNGRIVTKIQYYIDITDQRPKNKTFFFGWVKRAMRQEK